MPPKKIEALVQEPDRHKDGLSKSPNKAQQIKVSQKKADQPQGKSPDGKIPKNGKIASPSSAQFVGNSKQLQDKKSTGKEKKKQIPSSKTVKEADSKEGKSPNKNAASGKGAKQEERNVKKSNEKGIKDRSSVNQVQMKEENQRKGKVGKGGIEAKDPSTQSPKGRNPQKGLGKSVPKIESKPKKEEDIIKQSGLLEAYELFLRAVCKHGLPEGNVYEFAAQQIQRFQRKKRAKQLKARAQQQIERAAMKRSERLQSIQND